MRIHSIMVNQHKLSVKTSLRRDGNLQHKYITIEKKERVVVVVVVKNKVRIETTHTKHKKKK